MDMSRRGFLGGAASMLALGAYGESGAPHRYRVCVIGDTKRGGYGHSLHLSWSLRNDVDIVGLADPDESGRSERAKECGAQRTYADYREMLEKEKPDIVTVGPRWTVDHKEYLLAAADIGAHGFMEKPLAVDVAEGDAMIAAIEAKNLRWAIAFNFRASPMAHHVKRLVFEEGLIGDVLEVRGHGKEDDRAGGEDLMVLGTHSFDLMRFWLGDPLWCMASVTVEGRPVAKSDAREATEPLGPVAGDRIQTAFGFKNGVTGHFASMKNRDGNGNRWGMDIYGSKGIVTFRMAPVPEVYLLRDGSWAPGKSGARWESLPDAPVVEMLNQAVDIYTPITSDLIAAIGENRAPSVSLRDGQASLEMIQAAYAAHLGGGRVDLPLAVRRHPLAAD